jgi:hypothetical protein
MDAKERDVIGAWNEKAHLQNESNNSIIDIFWIDEKRFVLDKVTLVEINQNVTIQFTTTCDL